MDTPNDTLDLFRLKEAILNWQASSADTEPSFEEREIRGQCGDICKSHQGTENDWVFKTHIQSQCLGQIGLSGSQHERRNVLSMKETNPSEHHDISPSELWTYKWFWQKSEQNTSPSSNTYIAPSPNTPSIATLLRVGNWSFQICSLVNNLSRLYSIVCIPQWLAEESPRCPWWHPRSHIQDEQALSEDNPLPRFLSWSNMPWNWCHTRKAE